MKATVTTSETELASPDFKRLRRYHKQLFLTAVFSQVYAVGWCFYVAFTSSYPLVFGLISLVVLGLCVMILRTYFSPKQAMLLTGDDNGITIHFTPYASRTIPAAELSGISWSGNRITLSSESGNSYTAHIGWMSYADNRAIRSWIQNFPEQH